MPKWVLHSLENDKVVIHNNLNIALVFGVYVTTFSLLVVASKLEVIWMALLGLLFSFLFITNYALMHEASHHVLHHRRKINYILGLISCSLFPQSFTLYEIAHQMHHRGNRTKFETFEYYSSVDTPFLRFRKRVHWYTILTGLWYPMLLLGTLFLAIVPGVYQSKYFSSSFGSVIMVENFRGWTIVKIRLEILLTALMWIVLWQALSLSLVAVGIFYLFAGINWSTRQYVSHAWTKRDVIEGAHNLKTSKLTQAMLLNGNYDHVHHKYPQLPWTELSNSKYHEIPMVSHFKQYLSLWRGPQLSDEPLPSPILNYTPSYK